MPENIKTYSFEKNSPENNKKESQRIKISKPLHDFGHIGDGKNKATEHEKRHDKKEGSHHSLLFG